MRARRRDTHGSRRRRLAAVAAAVVPVVLGGCGGAGPGERPNILLVTIDTLRADHLLVISGAIDPELRGGWKLIRNLDDDSFELYHLPSDPAERDDRWRVEARSTDGPAVELRRLLAELDDLPDGQSAVLELTAEERRQLEALGYVDGGP